MPESINAIVAIVIVCALVAAFGVGWGLGGRAQRRNQASVDAQREQMQQAFTALAAQVVNQNSEVFLAQADARFKSRQEIAEKDLDAKKQLIDKSLQGMNEKLDSIHKQSTELRSSIATSHEATQDLREDTKRLRQILSSSQQRGQWGERMVEDILRVVGLVKNVNYTQQTQVDSGQRPDFTFLLPREKCLNMDVKFPLAHYEKYLAAETPETQESEKTAFFRDIKNHIKTVSGREYINPADGTLEYVMLFIPNESIYGFINTHDAKLVDYALQKRVLLCSPLTLYAVLSLIHQAARNFQMNERAAEVMSLVQEFRNQWGKYVEQSEKVGTRIEQLSRAFDDLVKTRTRALEKPLNKLEGKSGDELPQQSSAELEHPPPPDSNP